MAVEAVTTREWVMEECDFAAACVLEPIRMDIAPVDALNSSADDYAPVVTPDGSKLISASGGYQQSDNSITFWDASTGQKLNSIPNAHSGYIRTLAVSPDGSKLFSAGDDKAISFWGRYAHR